MCQGIDNNRRDFKQENVKFVSKMLLNPGVFLRQQMHQGCDTRDFSMSFTVKKINFEAIYFDSR